MKSLTAKSNLFLQLIIIWSILFLLSGCAQTVFLKTYGNSNANEIPGAVLQTANKDLVIVSNKQSGSSNGVILMRTDKNGGIWWENEFSVQNPSGGIPSQTIEAANGDLVMIGSSISNVIGGDFFIMRTNSGGNLLWVKDYGGYQIVGKSIVETPSGHFVVTGSVYYPTSSARSAFLAEFDATGGLIWQKYYQTGSNLDPAFVRLYPNGGFVVAGTSQLDNCAFLMQVDATGQVVWFNEYIGPSGLEAIGFQVSANELVVSGHADNPTISDPFLLVTDLNGNLKWARRYQMNLPQDDCTVSLTENSGYLIQGVTQTGLFSNSHVFILAINNSGNPLWCKEFTGVQFALSTNFFTGHSGATPATLYDNGYAIVAGQKSNIANEYNIGLFRTDRKGRIPCNQMNIIPSLNPIVINQQSLPVTGANFALNSANFSYTYFPVQLPLDQSCSQVNCIRPPDGLVAWYQFNNTLSDAVGTSNATAGTGVNTTYTLGKNSLAVQMNGINDHFIAPAAAPLDFGTGDFAIDFWIKVANGTTGVMTVLDKLNSKGYTLNINNGVPEIFINDGYSTGTFNCGVNIADNSWHLVAISVERNNSSGGKWYIDGNSTSVFNPTILNHSISNTSALLMGKRALGSPQYLKGSLDELELFNTIITGEQLQELFFSGVEGKCSNVAYAPPLAGLCAADSHVDVSFSICNYGPNPRVYTLTSVAGLPANQAGCDVDGPNSYTVVSSPSITVQPGDCGIITVKLPKPTGLTTFFDKACYEASFQDDLGNAFWVDAGIVLYNCIKISGDGTGFKNSEPVEIPLKTPMKLSLQIENNNLTAPLKYRVKACKSDGSIVTDGSFAINGTNMLSGEIPLEKDKMDQLVFEVQFNAPKLMSYAQMLVEIEQDGVYKPVYSKLFECTRPN